MKIKGKVHCFFEQSGTFKREFIKLGIPAEDYDIQNNFGETDHVMDLFHEIDECYRGGVSVFDKISKDDFVMAFYPCIYFCACSQMHFYLTSKNYVNLSTGEKYEAILERSKLREEFYSRLLRFCKVCETRGIRMAFENPWSMQTYLKSNFVKVPDVIDNNRITRGDHVRKPTAYWFFNCHPTHGETFNPGVKGKTITKMKRGIRAGVCGEERSMIAPEYAHNFICDFILGKPSGTVASQGDLFDQKVSK